MDEYEHLRESADDTPAPVAQPLNSMTSGVGAPPDHWHPWPCMFEACDIPAPKYRHDPAARSVPSDRPAPSDRDAERLATLMDETQPGTCYGPVTTLLWAESILAHVGPDGDFPTLRHHDPGLTDPDNAALPWVVRTTCCGRDNGEERFATWEEADQYRRDFVDGLIAPATAVGLAAAHRDRSALLVGGSVPDNAALREALAGAIQTLPEMVGEPNPGGWSLVRRKDVLATLAAHEVTIEAIALRSPAAGQVVGLRAWWESLTDDDRWRAFVIEKSNADNLAAAPASPSGSSPVAAGLDVERLRDIANRALDALSRERGGPDSKGYEDYDIEEMRAALASPADPHGSSSPAGHADPEEAGR